MSAVDVTGSSPRPTCRSRGGGRVSVCELSLAEVAGLLRRGEASPVEVAEAALERIAEADPRSARS